LIDGVSGANLHSQLRSGNVMGMNLTSALG
jgi:hypothetical protein